MARTLIGSVTSDKPDKTVVISIKTRPTHRVYKKQYSRTTKFMIHDEKNEAKIGDVIQAKETKPLSGHKRFILEKIIQRSIVQFEETDATADVPQPEVTEGTK